MTERKATFSQFRHGSTIAINDIRLQGAFERSNIHFRIGRQTALDELPAADELRDGFKALRQATIAQLARHLETFERNANAAGGWSHRPLGQRRGRSMPDRDPDRPSAWSHFNYQKQIDGHGRNSAKPGITRSRHPSRGDRPGRMDHPIGQ